MKVAVSSRSPDGLDLFVIRNDFTMYHQMWSETEGWGSSGRLDQNFLCFDASAASWDSGRIDVMAIRGQTIQERRRTQHTFWEGGVWKSWSDVPRLRDSLVNTALCAPWPGRLHAFGVDPHQEVGTFNGQIVWGPRIISSEMYHLYGDGSSWGLQNISGYCRSSPAAVACGHDRIDVFVLGHDKALYHKSAALFFTIGGESWSWAPSQNDWEAVWGEHPTRGFIQASPFAYGVGACSWAKGRIDLFGVDDNTHEMQHLWGNGTSCWWETLGGYCISQPAAVARDINRMDVFVVGGDRRIYVNSWGPIIDRFPGTP